MTGATTTSAAYASLNHLNGVSSTPSLNGSNYRLQDLEPQSSLVTWKIDSARAALLIHDMQNYFVRSLPHEPRRELVHNTSCLLKWARSLDIPVFFTAQPGGMTTEQRGLLHDFWGPGMKASEADRMILPELQPLEDETKLTKWRYSAFSRTRFAEHLSMVSRDQLIITGVFASIGIQATAIDSSTLR